MGNKLMTLAQVSAFQPAQERKLFSAQHEEIRQGATTDVYFVKTQEILEKYDLNDTIVAAEIFALRAGVLAGVPEVLGLFTDSPVEIWSLQEGQAFAPKEVVMQIRGKYSDIGIYETPLLGILASSSGWASAAKEAKAAAGDKPVLCFGARHVHPAVAPVMERAAVIGGADGASCILGAKLLGKEPAGTVPHAIFLIMGDSVKVAKAYHEIMPSGEPRTVLVDTFKDEAEEALRVAEALGSNLQGIRLDTPSERGGVTPELVKEIRGRLNQKGFSDVQIFVSGGLTPEKISLLKEAGVDAFGVGSYISGATPIDMTMDIKEVAGKPVAKRGRIPGLRPNQRLCKIK